VMATDHQPNRSTTNGPSSHHCQPAVPATTHNSGRTYQDRDLRSI
jgi:hypothetical protein